MRPSAPRARDLRRPRHRRHHVDLKAAIAERRFRGPLPPLRDQLTLPGLADRADDVLPLAEHFLARATAASGAVRRLSGGRAAALPVRLARQRPRLQNAIERAVNLCVGDLVTRRPPPSLHRPRGTSSTAPSTAR